MSPKYTLLEPEREADNFSISRKASPNALLRAALLISIVGNVGLLMIAGRLLVRPDHCKSRYTGLSLDTPIAYERQASPYVDQTDLNQTDALWDAFDTSLNAVALTDAWARDHGLPISASRFPWDDDKGIYHVKAYHHLHCLKNLYKSSSETHRGLPQSIPFTHILHCLDVLRQDVMCNADDTPMPEGGASGTIGQGQVRSCKNLESLKEWTQAPERNACFRKLSDYRHITHSLEQFAYCPEDSPYLEVSRQYFETYGHKDPFEEPKV